MPELLEYEGGERGGWIASSISRHRVIAMEVLESRSRRLDRRPLSGEVVADHGNVRGMQNRDGWTMDDRVASCGWVDESSHV
jgi:hypothetical protein